MAGFISNTIQAHIARYNKPAGEYEYLLLRRAPNNPLYPGIWQVVTGTAENDETSLDTAQREIAEETGIKPDILWVLPYIAHFFDSKNDLINSSPVFGAIFDCCTEIRLSAEHSDFEWVKYERCMELLPLPSHKDGTTIFRDYVLNKGDKSMFRVEI